MRGISLPLLIPRRALRRLVVLIVLASVVYILGSAIKRILLAVHELVLSPASGLTGIDVVRHEESPKGIPLAMHRYLDNGMLEVNPEGPHPIFELMKDAETQWHEKVSRQSTTLGEAVREYRRRHKHHPPKGYDLWWKYVRENNVPLPDEYAIIYQDLEPLWGVSPADLNRLLDDAEISGDTWTLGKRSESEQIDLIKVSIGDEYDHDELLLAATELLPILQPISDALPPFRVVVYPHDAPVFTSDWELKQLLLTASQKGEYVNLTEPPLPKKYNGWVAACSPMSPLWRKSMDFFSHTPPPSLLRHHKPNDVKTFIHDHVKTMDPCEHPDLLRSHGQFLRYLNPGHLPSRLPIPLFSWSPTFLHSDMRIANTLNWRDPFPPPLWEEKSEEKLYWRGATTGILSDDSFSLDGQRVIPTRWRWSHRVRMNRLASPVDPLVVEHGAKAYKSTLHLQPDEGFDVDTYWILPSPQNDTHSVGASKPVRRASFVSTMLDIHYAGKPRTCTSETCKLLSKMFEFTAFEHDAVLEKHKYILDVRNSMDLMADYQCPPQMDGNGWSSRFQRLLTANVVVFKSTIYPEWFADRIQPWYHYVPIQTDFSDLFDALAFFRGDKGEEGGRDDLAKIMAARAHDWCLTHWRKEDIGAYMFLLFLEYGRLLSPDRAKMNFIFED